MNPRLKAGATLPIQFNIQAAYRLSGSDPTMADKVSELKRLLESGYIVEAIESDDACVEATLRREGRVMKLRLFRSDAESLLFGQMPGRVRVRR